MNAIEQNTGYYSILVCVHKDITVFYRTGRELAIFRHNGVVLEWSKDVEESDKLELRVAIDMFREIVKR